MGTLELLFPRIREGRFQTQLFARYQRSEKAVVSRVFRTLKRRKLRGVKLVVSFDHEGAARCRKVLPASYLAKCHPLPAESLRLCEEK